MQSNARRRGAMFMRRKGSIYVNSSFSDGKVRCSNILGRVCIRVCACVSVLACILYTYNAERKREERMSIVSFKLIKSIEVRNECPTHRDGQN